MSSLKSDMSGLDGYVLLGGQICSVTRNFEQQKSRSGAKMMRLGPDNLLLVS
jgi:hypothetical protein